MDSSAQGPGLSSQIRPERIDVRRLARVLFFSLVLPLSLAIGLDFGLNTMPLATIVASVIFIPLAMVVVSRVALSEFDKVIQAVAPAEAEPVAQDEPAAEEDESGSPP